MVGGRYGYGSPLPLPILPLGAVRSRSYLLPSGFSVLLEEQRGYKGKNNISPVTADSEDRLDTPGPSRLITMGKAPKTSGDRRIKI